MLTRTAPISCLTIVLACFGEDARARDIDANLGITAVTVYRQGASITRSATLAVPAGEHRLIIKNLPAGLDVAQLRVAIGSTAVTLGGVETEVINATGFVTEKERALRQTLETRTDQRAVIQDEIATAESQLKLLDSLVAAPTGSATKPAVDSSSLSALLANVSSGGTAARSRVRDGKIRLRAIEREIAALEADLKKVATERKSTTEVRAFLQATSPVTAPVALSYVVRDAEWKWIYEGRLDTEAKSVELQRSAAVMQRTGEEWNSIVLTLATTQPSGRNALKPLEPLFLTSQEPKKPDVDADFSRGSSFGEGALQEVVVTANRRDSRRRQRDSSEDVKAEPYEAESISTEYLTDYKIPGKVTVAANREPRVVPIQQDRFQVEILARISPRVERAAYLEAKFRYELETPMQGGALQLFRDGAYIGQASMPMLQPGSDVRLPFGVDERIRVQVRDEQAQSGEGGVLSRQRMLDVRQRFEVTSFHSRVIPIEVVDRIPVAKSGDVKITVPKEATPPAEKDYEGKAGVLLWKLAAPPKALQTIRHYYQVKFPGDHELREIRKE